VSEHFRTLLSRLDLEPPLFAAARLAPPLTAALEEYERRGLVRPLSASTWAVCEGCFRRNDVVIVPTPIGPRTVLTCPECGPQAVPEARLRRWEVDAGGLASQAATAARLKGGAEEIVPRRLWRLGAANVAGRSREYLFLRVLPGMGQAAATEVLARHSAAVLFLPTEQSGLNWRDNPANVRVALESVLTEENSALAFDHGPVADAIAGKVRPPAKKQVKPPKRSPRETKIAQLEREMKKHLRAAREHAWSLISAKKPPQLLPRPAQQFLAALTGMSESSVHRCLHDPEAVFLKLLWDTALDLEQVIHWKEPTSSLVE
jgi:hypothetical protein